jgi:hypothetical protein
VTGEAGVLPNTFDMIVPKILIARSYFTIPVLTRSFCVYGAAESLCRHPRDYARNRPANGNASRRRHAAVEHRLVLQTRDPTTVCGAPRPKKTGLGEPHNAGQDPPPLPSTKIFSIKDAKDRWSSAAAFSNVAARIANLPIWDALIRGPFQHLDAHSL